MQIEIVALIPIDSPVLITKDDILDILVRSQRLSPVLSLNPDQNRRRIKYQNLESEECTTEAFISFDIGLNALKDKRLLTISLEIPPRRCNLNHFDQIKAFHFMGLEIKSQIRAAESDHIEHIDQIDNHEQFYLMSRKLNQNSLETDIRVTVILDETCDHFLTLGSALFEETRQNMINYIRGHFRLKGYYPEDTTADKVATLDFMQLYHLIFRKTRKLFDEDFDKIVMRHKLTKEDREDLKRYRTMSNWKENFPQHDTEDLEFHYRDIMEYYFMIFGKKPFTHLQYDNLVFITATIDEMLSRADFPDSVVLT